MDAKNFMIGDWVSSPRLRSHGGGNYFHQLERIDLGCEYDPIPLTEDILRANGFDIGSDNFIERRYEGYNKHKDYEFWCNSFTDKGKKKVVEFRIAKNYIQEDYREPYLNYILTIHYVHELQHALRLCDLNELSDNFKIE